MLSAFTGLWTDRLWFNSVGYGEVFIDRADHAGAALHRLRRWSWAASSPPTWSSPSGTGRRSGRCRRRRTSSATARSWSRCAPGWSSRSRGLLALVAGGSAAGSVALLPAVAQRRRLRHRRTPTSSGHRLLHLRPAVAALRRQLRDDDGRCSAWSPRSSCTTSSAASRCSRARDKVSGAAQVQFSVLLGLFVLFKAVDYWLDRFDLTTDQGRRFTGVNYTAFNAILPSKNILMFIALICALLFFANVFRRTWLLPGAGLGLLVLSGDPAGRGVAGHRVAVPGQAVASPTRSRSSWPRNIEATRAAYNIDDVAEQQYDADGLGDQGPAEEQRRLAARHPADRPGAHQPGVRAAAAGAWLLLRGAGARRRPLRDQRRDPRPRDGRARARPGRASSPTSATGPTSTPSTPTATAWSRRSATTGPPTAARRRTRTSRRGPRRTCRRAVSSPT